MLRRSQILVACSLLGLLGSFPTWADESAPANQPEGERGTLPMQRAPVSAAQPPVGPDSVDGVVTMKLPTKRDGLRDIAFGEIFTRSPAAGKLQQGEPDLEEPPQGRDPYWGVGSFQTFAWKSPSLVHRTLYFEDAPLERYGHSWGPCLQPVVSGWRFFRDAVTVPYREHYQRPRDV
ncbi:MAG: hypothetical protein KDA60_22925, partial [Planctomycetales bacterium]|nr:hypothetical protein [Planctomycetales bacterium]